MIAEGRASLASEKRLNHLGVEASALRLECLLVGGVDPRRGHSVHHLPTYLLVAFVCQLDALTPRCWYF
jgi:hypothetical protein